MENLIIELMALKSRLQKDIDFKSDAISCIDKAIQELNKHSDDFSDEYKLLEVSQVAQWLHSSNSFVVDSFKSKGIPLVKKSIERDSQKPKYLIPVASYKQYVKACQV